MEMGLTDSNCSSNKIRRKSPPAEVWIGKKKGIPLSQSRDDRLFVPNTRPWGNNSISTNASQLFVLPRNRGLRRGVMES